MDFFFRNSYLEPKPGPPVSTGSNHASPSRSLTVAVAISGSTKSKNVLKWALKKFASEKNIVFKLIHIHPKLTSIPTPCKLYRFSSLPETLCDLIKDPETGFCFLTKPET